MGTPEGPHFCGPHALRVEAEPGTSSDQGLSPQPKEGAEPATGWLSLGPFGSRGSEGWLPQTWPWREGDGQGRPSGCGPNRGALPSLWNGGPPGLPGYPSVMIPTGGGGRTGPRALAPGDRALGSRRPDFPRRWCGTDSAPLSLLHPLPVSSGRGG